MKIFCQLLILTGLVATPALATDVSPAMPKDEMEEKCDAKGGEYFEDGSDFYGCKLPNDTTVGCLDWYGCIAWKETPTNRVIRDHRLNRQFGVLLVLPKPTMARYHRPVARAYRAMLPQGPLGVQPFRAY